MNARAPRGTHVLVPSARLAWLPTLFALVACGSGCSTAFAPVVDEPVRTETVRDVGHAALGLRHGVTTLEEARQAMIAQHLTGVSSDAWADATGPALAVLGADYQRELHLFRDGRYAGSFALPTLGLPPYGLALRLARAGSDTILLVLHRDPLGRESEPPRLLSFRVGDAAVELLGRASLGAIAARQGGMTHPKLVGDSLTDEGVMLVARDRDGALWDTSWVLRFSPRSLELAPRPMADALRCSCVRKYAMNLE